MRTPSRTALRLAFQGCLGLVVLASTAAIGRAAVEPEKVLPDSTLFFLKVKDVAQLRESFKGSGFGQLLADPAMKPFKDNIADKLGQAGKEVKARLGVTIDQLLTLPQGPASIAIVAKPDAKIPVAALICVDAGKNEKTMTDVMLKSTKQAEEANAKVGSESFKGLTLHVITPPKDGDKPTVPLVWTNSGGIFHIASDVDALKDYISHADGRSDSLASVDSFVKVKAKLGSDAPVAWFFDINKGIKLVLKAAQGANPGGGAAQNAEGILQMLGVNGLKAAGGTLSVNTGAYDSISKVFFLSPAPAQGILKMFQMPVANLRPEPWVPATVARYQTLSWDLDAAYSSLNELVNMIQPGMLNQVEQMLVGPNGGEPLSLQKDLFGPLGDRITVVSDYKKPIKEDSQRVLIGISLEDSKAFANTLNKLIGMAGGAPAKREFQGTTIYDFALPQMPNPGGGPDNNPFKSGTASVAIAKDTLYVATEPAILESTLRGGGSPLAESPAFLAVAKLMPAKTSSLTYSKGEEQARASYDMIKGGQLDQFIKVNPQGPDVGKIIDKDKLPDFSVFAKYISEAGGFGLMEDDGVTFTSFTLRKATP